MLQKIGLLLALTFLLVGCTKTSTVININLPIEEAEALGNLTPVVNINKNTNTNSNTNISVNSNINPGSINSNTAVPPVIVPVEIEIPIKLELDVAFAPQAPFGNWNELNEEACEEASIITAAKYFLNQSLNEQIMEAEIIKLDNWEKSYGYKIDLSANETAEIIREYFKLQAKVVSDVSVDRIKYELNLGHLVIVPLAGRELNNPYFRSPGPIYHMLVIKGYNSSEFITNEVGTKRGDGFRYKYQTLINAVHDWDPTWSHYDVTDAQMTSGPKKMVIVSK